MKTLRNICEGILSSDELGNAIQNTEHFSAIEAFLQPYMDKFLGKMVQSSYDKASASESEVNGIILTFEKILKQNCIKSGLKKNATFKALTSDHVVVMRLPKNDDVTYVFYIPQPNRNNDVAEKICIHTKRGINIATRKIDQWIRIYKVPHVMVFKAGDFNNSDATYYVLGNADLWREWSEKIKTR